MPFFTKERLKSIVIYSVIFIIFYLILYVVFLNRFVILEVLKVSLVIIAITFMNHFFFWLFRKLIGKGCQAEK